MNTFVDAPPLSSTIDGFINSSVAVGLLVISLGGAAVIEKKLFDKKSKAIKSMDHLCEDEVTDIVEDIFHPDEIQNIVVSRLSEVVSSEDVEKYGKPNDYALKMTFMYTDKSIVDDYFAYQFTTRNNFARILSIMFQNDKVAYIDLNAKTIFRDEKDENVFSFEDAISINASRKKFESVDLEALADMVDEDPYKSMFDKCESYYVNPKLKIKRKKVDESELRYDSRFVKKMN